MNEGKKGPRKLYPVPKEKKGAARSKEHDMFHGIHGYFSSRGGQKPYNPRAKRRKKNKVARISRRINREFSERR